MCYHNTVKRTLCGLYQKVKERWGEAGLTPNGPGWRQREDRALLPGHRHCLLTEKQTGTCPVSGWLGSFQRGHEKTFTLYPLILFFFFKPKLERKQTYSGHNVARKETQKSRHFIRKALTGSEPTWPRIWGSFVWGGKQATKPRGLGERLSQVGGSDVSHAAGCRGRMLGSIFLD